MKTPAFFSILFMAGLPKRLLEISGMPLAFGLVSSSGSNRPKTRISVPSTAISPAFQILWVTVKLLPPKREMKLPISTSFV